MRVVVCSALLSAAAFAQGLTLVEPVISDIEGGLYVSDDRKFMPGDRVFLRFKVRGFQKDDSNQVFLEYSIEAVDRDGLPFEPSRQDRLITKTLRSESRFLTYAFEVPFSPKPGEGKFRISVQDRLGGGSIKTELPFKVGSDLPEPTGAFAIQGFRYLQSDVDEMPIEEPVYRGGATVWGRFYLSGFEWSENHRYKLSYGVTLRNKAGRVLFTEQQAVSESRESFYPKWHVPGLISVRLEYMIRPGEYSITIDARDENSGKTTKAEFPVIVR